MVSYNGSDLIITIKNTSPAHLHVSIIKAVMYSSMAISQHQLNSADNEAAACAIDSLTLLGSHLLPDEEQMDKLYSKELLTLNNKKTE